jgi:signal transduction histidine kinase
MSDAILRISELETTRECPGHGPATLKVLKHELRTPINHIIGYSELLAEAAEDEGRVEYSELARKIHSAGHALTKLVEVKLPVGAETLDAHAISELREDLQSAIANVLDIVNGWLCSGPGPYSRDLGLIRSAAERLLGQVCQPPAN